MYRLALNKEMLFNYNRNCVFHDEVHNKIDKALKGSRFRVTMTIMSNFIYFHSPTSIRITYIVITAIEFYNDKI